METINDEKVISIGKLKITLPAFIILVTGLTAVLFIILLAPYFWFVALYLLFVVLVSTYAVNCTIVGKCRIYAWIVCAVAILSYVFVVISLVLRVRELNRMSTFRLDIKPNASKASNASTVPLQQTQLQSSMTQQPVKPL